MGKIVKGRRSIRASSVRGRSCSSRTGVRAFEALEKGEEAKLRVKNEKPMTKLPLTNCSERRKRPSSHETQSLALLEQRGGNRGR